MKTLHGLWIVALLIGVVGCNEPTKETKGTANSDHGHEHADGTHDHSDSHGHGAGPHDGAIADWGGGKYHVEFTVDHGKKEATIYVLGSDEKSAVPIDAKSIELSIVDPKMQFTLIASPQAGDPEGKASRFVGTHDKLGTVQEFAGKISGVVDGTPYSGDFKEESHGDHAH